MSGIWVAITILCVFVMVLAWLVRELSSFVGEIIDYLAPDAPPPAKGLPISRDENSGDLGKGTYTHTPNFAVNGTPRRKPWHIRKRELEEAARTKRKKLESFQEYV